MCGITGSVWLDDSNGIDASLLKAMTDAITHRGPDDDGHWIKPDHYDGQGRKHGVALGFRRLSIIDVAGAAQPLSNEDGSVQLIFNGEIYNYKTLRRRLEGSGHQFSTHGDGETIVHLYEDLGLECFAQLNGMFAVAIWDAKRSRLVLARDRIGQKPLYYAVAGNRIVFGSELKCLAKVPGVCREIDRTSIDEFLTYQYVPHPGTIWKGVRKLAPGHLAVFEKGDVDVRKYWNFDPTIQTPWSRREAAERLRELLNDSVKLRLQSDVPLGAFLSGGIDSSLITAIAQKQLDRPVRTFSIGFPISDFDETGYAAQVAEHLGTDHQRFEVQPDGVEIIDQLVWHFDEPFGDSSAVPTWYLSQMTRNEVTVALSGDGGDELFAGYERYRALWLSVRLRRMFPVHKLPGIGLIQKLPDSNKQYSTIRRAKRFFEALDQSEARRYLNWLQIFPERMRADLYTDEFLAELPGEDPFDFLDAVWSRSEGRDVVTRASITDMLSYLPCDLCTKVDIASMAHSLEVRQPMLDYRVAEFAASLPVDLKFRGNRGKLLLQDAFGDLIPRSIFTRRKMGFGIPIGAWFRNELKPMVQNVLLGDDARIASYFRRDAVQRLVTQHENKENNHGYRLWSLLILEKWLRRWSG